MMKGYLSRIWGKRYQSQCFLPQTTQSFVLRMQISLKSCRDAGIFDRVVVSEILKDIAQTQQISKIGKEFQRYWICILIHSCGHPRGRKNDQGCSAVPQAYHGKILFEFTHFDDMQHDKQRHRAH